MLQHKRTTNSFRNSFKALLISLNFKVLNRLSLFFRCIDFQSSVGARFIGTGSWVGLEDKRKINEQNGHRPT